jgi:hypothetical protein
MCNRFNTVTEQESFNTHPFNLLFDSSVGIASGYRLDSRGLIPGRGKRFSVFHSVQTGSGTHPASYTMFTWALSMGVKWPGREADHSPPSSAEVKNGGAIPPLPHKSSWHSVLLIKHREKLTFYVCQSRHY